MKTTTSNRPFVKVLFIIGIIIGAFWIASFFPDLVITLIVSVLLAFVLRPLVTLLEFRLGLRRGFSIAIVFLVVGGLTVLAAIELVPIAIDRIKSMYDGFKNFPFDQKLNEAAKNLTASIPFTDPNSVTNKGT